ncbi:SRPBCC family protein [Streptomyces sp. NPDC001922]|uniref:SRPBCC family protein n=1 Tax=Streptomyces sp. NPDC001922 TaxID=3364624 RepID=UPI0036A2DC8F
MTDGPKGTSNPVSTLKDSVVGNPATDRLKEEAAAFAAAQAQRLLISAGRKLGGATTKLNDIAEGNSPGLFHLAKEGGKKFAEGKGPVRSAVEIGAANLKDTLKDKVKDAFQGLGGGKRKGGGGKGRFVTIVEDIDVGVPVREAYNQWTQFQEFSTFAKGVQGVESADDTTSNWRAKIFWSSRSWKANTTEQIRDRRIAWTSEGAKGSTKGVVTFHPLGENLTTVLLVIEYYPKGLFEKTGNIWRAQGRRARLDLKHFRRFLMMRGEATGEWRGEIRDGEVVLSHEDALAEEERAEEERGEEPADAGHGHGAEDGAAGDDGPGDEEFDDGAEDHEDSEEAGAEYDDPEGEDDEDDDGEPYDEDGHDADDEAPEDEELPEDEYEADDDNDGAYETEDAHEDDGDYDDEYQDDDVAEEEPERVRASR